MAAEADWLWRKVMVDKAEAGGGRERDTVVVDRHGLERKKGAENGEGICLPLVW